MQTQSDNNREVAIIIPGNKFGEFITGLLGRPQSIQRVIHAPFLITRNDVMSLHHLIHYRIQEQNKAALVQFQSRVIYSDGLSIELNRLDDFESYVEARRASTASLVLTWVYVIEFHGRELPEKQQIEITFSTKSPPDFFDAARLSRSMRITGDYDTNIVAVRITHTARSWGMDVESLLHGQLRVYVREETGIPRVLWLCSTLIGWVSGLGVFCILIFVGTFPLHFFTSQFVLGIANLDRSLTIDQINSKMNLLLAWLSGGRSYSLTVAVLFYIVIAIAISVAAGIEAGGTASKQRPSFIVFTDLDETARQAADAAYERGWKITLISALMAIICGVISNILFVKLW